MKYAGIFRYWLENQLAWLEVLASDEDTVVIEIVDSYSFDGVEDLEDVLDS